MTSLIVALTVALKWLDPQAPPPPQPPHVVSPVIGTDRSVTFSLWAPRASEVQLSGNWMRPRPPMSLTRGENGVWSISVRPLEPHIYSYGFMATARRELAELLPQLFKPHVARRPRTR